MNEVRIELPFPPPQLSPNARVHWRKKAKAVADYREACGWAAHVDVIVAQGGDTALDTPEPLEPPVRAVVTFVVPNRRRRDEDNLLASLKPAWDGLVDAGVLAGDDSERFSVESATVGWRSDAEPKVIVELRSL